MSANQIFSPTVLVFAGNDPSGGAGITADTEAIRAQGCRIAPVITALTEQNTQNVTSFVTTDVDFLIKQAKAVLNDIPVKAIKLGMLGSIENINALSILLEEYPQIPVVIDPVLVATGGGILSESGVERSYQHLFAQATLITPNVPEAYRLAPGATSLVEAGNKLLALGCKHVLITGGDDDTPKVINRYFCHDKPCQEFTFPRFAEQYHGSGCTLASAIAAHLAKGAVVPNAITQALAYTQNAIVRGFKPGKGQFVLSR